MNLSGRDWHFQHTMPDRFMKTMTAGQHQAFMKRMGVSEEEDRKWHETHGVTRPRSARK